MMSMTADSIYGGGPSRIDGVNGGQAGKIAGGGEPVMEPGAAVAPKANRGAGAMSARQLMDDPTFWLVALAGAAVGLARFSADR